MLPSAETKAPGLLGKNTFAVMLAPTPDGRIDGAHIPCSAPAKSSFPATGKVHDVTEMATTGLLLLPPSTRAHGQLIRTQCRTHFMCISGPLNVGMREGKNTAGLNAMEGCDAE